MFITPSRDRDEALFDVFSKLRGGPRYGVMLCESGDASELSVVAPSVPGVEDSARDVVKGRTLGSPALRRAEATVMLGPAAVGSATPSEARAVVESIVTPGTTWYSRICSTVSTARLAALLGGLCCVGGGDGVETVGMTARGAASAFAGFRFPPEVIAVAVRWYLRYGLSYADVEELLAERASSSTTSASTDGSRGSRPSSSPPRGAVGMSLATGGSSTRPT